MSCIVLARISPGSTIQDRGRPGYLRHGISASGPMDRASFAEAGQLLGQKCGVAGIEFTLTGVEFGVEGDMRAGFAGGEFRLKVDGKPHSWPALVALSDGDTVEVSPGPAGVYGYLRFDRDIDVPLVLGSRATNLIAGLGGLQGRALNKGDRIALFEVAAESPPGQHSRAPDRPAIAVLPGLHADQLGSALWARFTEAEFRVSSRLDRMGIRLEDPEGVFTGLATRTLVSDAVVPGDVQILGDGTPVVLMRDHQPTGGYPRIATVIGADLDRLAQMRPGTGVRFSPVTLVHARVLAREART
ncbi:MAG: biotin-dependent carboxyltransferase family protein [Cucumibacter sp.]